MLIANNVNRKPICIIYNRHSPRLLSFLCSRGRSQPELTDQLTSPVYTYVFAVVGLDDYQEQGGQEVGLGPRARRLIRVRPRGCR